jgi:hypothetical protein
MTEKEIVLETIRALPDDCSLEEIAERIEFMAAVQKGLDQLDRGEGIPHDEVKKQLASWLTNKSDLPPTRPSRSSRLHHATLHNRATSLVSSNG